MTLKRKLKKWRIKRYKKSLSTCYKLLRIARRLETQHKYRQRILQMELSRVSPGVLIEKKLPGYINQMRMLALTLR